MRRRDFITFVGGAAASMPPAARAQQPERERRIGVVQGASAGDPDVQVAFAAFLQGLQRSGWIDGRNVRIDRRSGGGDADVIRKHVAELVALAPDVIVTAGSAATTLVLQATRTVPIVFVFVPDPVGSGFVKSLSRPGGNATGFMQFEYNLAAKWLELLKEIAPGVARAAVLWDPTVPSGIGQFAIIQSVAPSLGVELIPVDMRDLEQDLAAFARSGSGGLIVTSSSLALVRRDIIVALAARHKLPAVYSFGVLAAAGGLVSYGADLIDQFQRTAGYVDRILKGEKPSDLPVQAPTKYHLAINLKTAKTLGLTVPPALLARADEVIE